MIASERSHGVCEVCREFNEAVGAIDVISGVQKNRVDDGTRTSSENTCSGGGIYIVIDSTLDAANCAVHRIVPCTVKDWGHRLAFVRTEKIKALVALEACVGITIISTLVNN